MLSEALRQFPTPWLTGIGLLIFASVFIGVVLFSFRRGGKAIYQEAAQLPFIEEKIHRE